MRDMISKGRARHPRGIVTGGRRLEWKDVEAIRSAYESGVGPSEIARQFLLTMRHVCKIVSWRCWKESGRTRALAGRPK